MSPYLANDSPRPVALRLSAITKTPVEDLFPPALYVVLSEGPMVGEIDVHRFAALSAARRLTLPAAQEALVEKGERDQALAAVLATLTPREREVIERRYGLGDYDEETLESIGARLRLSRERIRQIEAKGLRKLRHPSRSRQLRWYAEP
jgi:RNA polymerase sigma factor (sigma-70 family)